MQHHNEMLIIPTPKVVRGGGESWPLESNGVHLILGPTPAPAEQEAARELRQFLQLRQVQARLIENPAAAGRPDTAVRIWLGRPEYSGPLRQLCARAGTVPTRTYPGAEGYLIRFLRDATGCNILLAAQSPAGVYFAAQTFKQLCRQGGGRLLIPAVAIDDWPTVKRRGLFVSDVAAGQELARFKFNSWDLCYIHHGFRWKNPTRAYLDFVKQMAVAAARRGLTANQFVNPTWSRNYRYGGGAEKICVSSARDMNALWNVFYHGLAQGCRVVTLCLDDRASARGSLGPADDYILTNPLDRQNFNGNLGQAHRRLCATIYRKMRRDFPAAVLVVVPTYYFGLLGAGGQSAADEYLRELGQLPDGVIIQWTGPWVRSVTIKPEHLKRYAGLIRRVPAYWDNSIYALHSPAYYLFDLYADGYYPSFAQSTAYGFHVNDNVKGVYDAVSQVALAQVSDYLWHPERYDAEQSRTRALRLFAGPAADKCLRYGELYHKIFDHYPPLRSDSQAAFVLDRRARLALFAGMAELQSLMTEIERTCANPRLAQSLQARFHQPLLRRFDHFRQIRRPKQTCRQRVPEGILLPATAFIGGRHGSDHIALHGTVSSVNAARACFGWKKAPSHACLLSVCAEDLFLMGGYATPARIRIALNGHRVYEGASQFLTEHRIARAYHLKREWLKRGENALTVENLERDYARRFKIFGAKIIDIV